jgi:hypothetical protein
MNRVVAVVNITHRHTPSRFRGIFRQSALHPECHLVHREDLQASDRLPYERLVNRDRVMGLPGRHGAATDLVQVGQLRLILGLESDSLGLGEAKSPRQRCNVSRELQWVRATIHHVSDQLEKE